MEVVARRASRAVFSLSLLFRRVIADSLWGGFQRR